MIIEGDVTRNVYIDGRLLTPMRSQAVYNHSPDGFAWGYGGSGPSQLALAILLEAGLSDNLAMALHHDFKWAYLAPLLEGEGFLLNLDVRTWANGQISEH